MLAPFAAIEQRVNDATMRRLSNAQATATTKFGEVITLPVIFDNAYADALGGFAESSGPSALVQSALVQDLVHGSQIEISARTWAIVEIQPDGTGMTRLVLEKAA
jgi:hypothetical protein